MDTQSYYFPPQFSKAMHLCFPQWDDGSVYANLLEMMLYPHDEEKQKSFTVRIQLEQSIVSQDSRGTPLSSEEYSAAFSKR